MKVESLIPHIEITCSYLSLAAPPSSPDIKSLGGDLAGYYWDTLFLRCEYILVFNVEG